MSYCAQIELTYWGSHFSLECTVFWGCSYSHGLWIRCWSTFLVCLFFTISKLASRLICIATFGKKLRACNQLHHNLKDAASLPSLSLVELTQRSFTTSWSWVWELTILLRLNVQSDILDYWLTLEGVSVIPIATCYLLENFSVSDL
jgi:hypothetical protein